MEAFDRRGVTHDQPLRRRAPAGSRFSDRLTRAFSKLDPIQANRQPVGDAGYPIYDHLSPDEEAVLPRFPITRQGYDCDAVDHHVAELEVELAELDREIGELRAHAVARTEVAVEIERIGEQTSAILVAAHDEAQETIRLARVQAATCIADAASYASALTEEANVQLRKVEADKLSISRERSRLMEDIRNTAAALSSVAETAAQRFPTDT